MPKDEGKGGKANLDNRANQMNPNHAEYRGSSSADLDNRANQMNPNHAEYRGSSKNKSK